MTQARRPDRLRQLIPQALVMACLAGGTCASLAADHDHAAAADQSRPLRAVTVAHVDPDPDPLPQQLVVIGRYATTDTPDPAPAGDPAAVTQPPLTPLTPLTPVTPLVPVVLTPIGPLPPDVFLPIIAPLPPLPPLALTAPDAPAAHPVRRPHDPARSHRRVTHHRHPRAIRYRHAGRTARAGRLTRWSRESAAVTDRVISRVTGTTSSATGALNWHRLAHCEASGRPGAVDPSGTYGGLYQFDVRTWHSVGGRGRPQDASAAEQTRRAMRLYARRGSGPWPVCGAGLYR